MYIKAMASDGGEVSDDKNGTFTLELKDLKMGSMIGKVRVTKQGMMVFNQQAVDDWTVRKEPLCLILCDANEFQKQKDNLIAIGRNQAKKKYDQKLAELKKQNDERKLEIDTYYSKLDSLEKEFRTAMQNMDKYADVFARIDESEGDTVAQRAIELFNRGEIEESLRLLEEQNYMEKIKKANRTIAQAEELASTAEQAKALAEQDKEKALEGIKIQIAAYKLQNEWDKAGKLLKELADNLNTLEAIWDYAEFCYNQNDFEKAETYYLKGIKILQNLNDNEPQKKLWMANIQNCLANLYFRTNQNEKSEKYFKSAVEIMECLSRSNFSANAYYRARLYNNYANLCRVTQRYEESEKLNLSALKLFENLSESDPYAFEADLATTRNSLGILYTEMHKYRESEEMLISALEIKRKLAASNPSVFEQDLALVMNNLAVLYSNTWQFKKSESMYNSTLEIYERLAKKKYFSI